MVTQCVNRWQRRLQVSLILTNLPAPSLSVSCLWKPVFRVFKYWMLWFNWVRKTEEVYRSKSVSVHLDCLSDLASVQKIVPEIADVNVPDNKNAASSYRTRLHGFTRRPEGERFKSKHLTVSKPDVTSCIPTIRAERAITLSTLINLLEGGYLWWGGNLLTSLWETGVMLGRGYVLRFGDQFEYRETVRLLTSLQGV
jgi:hypothetical protein